ncbi:hypothetical protein IW261DRAFT_102514 [Armillaria novae-zelandiae]|uniref:Uncharacterized protein n=1 Tax=Armillaria novae-zelandiae TaxID=153914 RepID=A0AA39PWX8_9AGAR|nr:hypothetical protein IW261DRAFT_102514 [Armillaria novae-zelandiae]
MCLFCCLTVHIFTLERDIHVVLGRGPQCLSVTVIQFSRIQTVRCWGPERREDVLCRRALSTIMYDGAAGLSIDGILRGLYSVSFYRLGPPALHAQSGCHFKGTHGGTR